jgi:hypothetical protein
VERHGEVGHAQARAEVPSDAGHHVDVTVPELPDQGPQFVAVEYPRMSAGPGCGQVVPRLFLLSDRDAWMSCLRIGSGSTHRVAGSGRRDRVAGRIGSQDTTIGAVASPDPGGGATVRKGLPEGTPGRAGRRPPRGTQWSRSTTYRASAAEGRGVTPAPASAASASATRAAASARAPSTPRRRT